MYKVVQFDSGREIEQEVEKIKRKNLKFYKFFLN